MLAETRARAPAPCAEVNRRQGGARSFRMEAAAGRRRLRWIGTAAGYAADSTIDTPVAV